jgi:hypothetical protein
VLYLHYQEDSDVEGTEEGLLTGSTSTMDKSAAPAAARDSALAVVSMYQARLLQCMLAICCAVAVAARTVFDGCIHCAASAGNVGVSLLTITQCCNSDTTVYTLPLTLTVHSWLRATPLHTALQLLLILLLLLLVLVPMLLAWLVGLSRVQRLQSVLPSLLLVLLLR